MNNTGAGSGWSVPPTNEQLRGALFGPRGLGLLAMVCGVYILVLAYIFPGYCDPLYAIHADIYFSPGLSARNPSLTAYFAWPRPAGYLAAHLFGLAGVQGFIFILVVITLLSTALTADLVQRVIGRRLPLTMVALYAGLVFSHPQFYVNYVHDTLATLSYLYVIAGMCAWYAYLEKPGPWRMALFFVPFLLAAFTKETYFVTAVLFWAAQVYLGGGRLRRTAAVILGAVFAAESAGLYWNLHSTETFIRLDDTSSAYSMDFSLSSMANVLWFYTKALMPLGVLIAVLAGLHAAFRERRFLVPIGALCLGGFCALLPHVPLPHHLSAQYAATGAPLLLAPFLLASAPFSGLSSNRWILGIGAAGLLALVVFFHRPDYEKNRWAVAQERINRNVMDVFPSWKNLPPADRRVLVTGLLTPVHPFHNQHYILREFGEAREWTILVARDIPQSDKPPVRLTSATDVDLSKFDRVFAFAPDGGLDGEWSGRQAAALDRGGEEDIPETDLVLFPALGPIREALREDPEAWYKRQEAGLVYWEWGQTEQAEAMLLGAVRRGGAANPYPYFYLGQISESRGDGDWARRYYEGAVEREASSPNPAFQEALERVR